MTKGPVSEDYSKPGTLPFYKLWGPEIKYSDQLANGDADDDKELEDEDDPSDPIADDDGFMHQWKIQQSNIEEWARRPKLINFVQTDDDVKPTDLAQKNVKAKFSDEIADGTAEDDLTTDDGDNEDYNVDENMVQVADSLY